MSVVADRPRVGLATIRGRATLIGPALVASAAYVDPGNVATNTVAGATFGYLLVWVVVCANLMAGLVQFLSAKLGIVTGRSLPEVLGDVLSRRVRVGYCVQAEVVAMATDLAEVAGGAIALQLLFGLPLLWGGVITTVVSLLVLRTRERHGHVAFERVVTAMLLVVAVGFVAGVVVDRPAPAVVAAGMVPSFAGAGSVVLAAGMLGATVMPHAIYAHSALSRDRFGRVGAEARAGVLAGARADVALAMLFAGAVNLALLLLGAGALSGDGRTGTIEGVHAGIGESLGPAVALVFALGLLFSGFASTAVGSYAGAVVLGGLLRVEVPLVVGRLLTALPALAVVAMGVNPTTALVVSQVVLSLGIPFVLLPLLVVTSIRSVMGEARNGPWTVVAGGIVCALVVALNVTLLVVTVSRAAT